MLIAIRLLCTYYSCIFNPKARCNASDTPGAFTDHRAAPPANHILFIDEGRTLEDTTPYETFSNPHEERKNNS